MEKVLLLLTMCISIILANLPTRIDEATMTKRREECRKEAEIDLDQINETSFYESPAGHCFITCLTMKTGVVNDKGEPQYDKTANIYDVPSGTDINAVIKKCYEEQKDETNICEKVAALQKCTVMEIHKANA